MKVAVNRSDIKEVLANVQALTGRKTNLVTTNCVLLKAVENKGLMLTATDLETGVEGFYPAQVERAGVVAVNAKKLNDIVQSFPVEEIRMEETRERWIHISGESVNYNLAGLNPLDFPAIPQSPTEGLVGIPETDLRKMIERATAISPKPDEKRLSVIGCYLDWVSEEGMPPAVRMVSTDFNRLALSEYTLPADTDVSQKTGILISKRGLSEIARFLDTGGEVLLGREKNYFFIKKAEETLSIILMEGEFPEYKGIIRAEEGNVVELNRLDFLMMVRRMAIFTTELYKGIKFHFDSDKLTITSQDPNLGDALEEMNIQFAGEPFETVFNPQFFIDSARSLDDEYMKLNLINAQGPCRVEGCEDTSYLCVIMPMKI